MLRNWFCFCHRRNVNAVFRILNLVLFLLLLFLWFDLRFEKVTLSPVNLRFFFGFFRGLLYSLLLLSLNLLSFFLSLACLSFTDLFILIFLISIKFAGTLVACLAHFLSHDLAEGTISSTISKYSLWFLPSLLIRHYLNVFDVRSGKCTNRNWLPLNKLKLFENFSFPEKSWATCCEHIYHVVNFDTFIKDTGHHMGPISCPFYAYSAIWFCFANLNLSFEVPKVNLSGQISKSSNHGNLWKRANSYSIAVPFAKLK